MRLPHATSMPVGAALAGVAAAFTLAGPAVAPADADRRAKPTTIRVLSPVAGKTVVGQTRLRAVVARRVRNVSFRVDAGRNRVARRHGRLTRDGGVLDTTVLRSGRHVLTVRGRVGQKIVVKRVAFDVSKPTRTLRATAPGKGRTKPGKTQAVVPVEPVETTPTTSVPTSGSGLFAEEFESDDFSKWDLFQAVSSDRIRSVPAFGGRSGNVGRFEARYGDHVNGEENTRAELAWGGDMFSEGETHTFRWSTYFDPNFTAEDEWVTTTQFKGDGTGGPPLELGVNGETFILNAGPHMDYVHLWSTPLVRGQWYDIVVRVHWSRDASKGNVEMWVGGAKVVDNYKMATLLPTVDNYFKIGHYRDADIRQTSVVYHDDLRITQE